MVSDYKSKLGYQILVSVPPSITFLLYVELSPPHWIQSPWNSHKDIPPPICLIQHRLGGWCVLGHFQCYFLWGSEESDVIRHQNTTHIFTNLNLRKTFGSFQKIIKPVWVGLMFVKQPGINSKRKQERFAKWKTSNLDSFEKNSLPRHLMGYFLCKKELSATIFSYWYSQILTLCETTN